MRPAWLPPLLIAAILAPAGEAADLLSAMRLTDIVVSGDRRVAIIETGHGEQRLITEGDSVAGCTVKRIRADGIDLDCRGRLKSLGLDGRARTAGLDRDPGRPPQST